MIIDYLVEPWHNKKTIFLMQGFRNQFKLSFFYIANLNTFILTRIVSVIILHVWSISSDLYYYYMSPRVKYP